MKSNVSIENAEIQDIPALIKLLAILFGIEADFQADVAKQTRGLTLLINAPENGVIKVAKNQVGQVIGMVSVQLVISTAQGSTSAWVEDMVIEEACRDKGVGKALLEAALIWAKGKGATRAQLLVDTENTAALGYYAHLGWEITQLQARKTFL
jgi:ribosomal protein S18 acetylase RimI-like enzyme